MGFHISRPKGHESTRTQKFRNYTHDFYESLFCTSVVRERGVDKYNGELGAEEGSLPKEGSKHREWRQETLKHEY